MEDSSIKGMRGFFLLSYFKRVLSGGMGLIMPLSIRSFVHSLAAVMIADAFW
jgi:hypothetical protein